MPRTRQPTCHHGNLTTAKPMKHPLWYGLAVFSCFWLWTWNGVTHAASEPPDPLPATWPPHPRLIATAADFKNLAARQARDPDLRDFVQGLIQQARQLERAPVLERKLEGRRLLGVSREALRRILLNAFAWQTTHDTVFLTRAKADLQAIAQFPDWNPSHFLDVAEMATAMALGYDWLYEGATEAERASWRRALIEKALEHGRRGHASFRSQNNWNQVCIGGLALAALAIGDEEPALARDVLRAGRAHIENGLRVYRPDGVYPEGPSYWEYGTSYTVLLVAALRSSLGTDWDILNTEGLLPSAAWLAHMTGPSGKFYNFADGGTGAGLMPSLFFFARELNQPALLAHQHSHARQFATRGRERFAPLAAFWWMPPAKQGDPSLPLFWSGQGKQPVAAWRTDWQDPNARYFAIKAGGAAANHAHMDGGSFILEWRGVRWAEDLGLQSYHSLESKGVQLWAMGQDSERWRIFRLGPFSHNTLTIDGKLHSATGMASLVQANEHGAQIDLTPIFLPGQVTRATRQVKFTPSGITLEDLIEGAQPGAVIRWAMATRARAEKTGVYALLQQDRQSLGVGFEGIPPATLDISQPATPLDAPNPGMSLLTASAIADQDGRCAIRVGFMASGQANKETNKP